MKMKKGARNWKIEEKPPALECPREFCFLWDDSEDKYGCPFGLCKRLEADYGERDFYEPHEPNLEQADLPWFYFIPEVENLEAEWREEYKRKSKNLWRH